MTAIPENIVITRGDTYSYDLAFFAEGARLDLTNWTIRFTVKTSKDDVDGSAIIQVLGTKTDATNGLGNIALTKTHTDTLTAGTYYYDVQIDSIVNTQVKTVRSGTFTVIKDVTRTSLS